MHYGLVMECDYRYGHSQEEGFDEAFALMSKGEKRTLIIPPEIGYGAREKGPIPANSTLIFEVELVDFK